MSKANVRFFSEFLLGAVLLAGVTYSAVARADVFDDQVPPDDSLLSENELVHKTIQIHDLAAHGGVADEDYYPIQVKPYSSYEVIVDYTSSDIATPSVPLSVQRLDSTGAVLQSSIGTSGIGYTRTLRWQSTVAGTMQQYIRVKSGSCTTSCTRAAVYRIRAYDTTYTIPRFYDHDSLLTSILLQNPNDYTVSANVMYWMGHDASLFGPKPYTLAPFSVAVIPPDPLLGVGCGLDGNGCAGHIVVTSDAGYGELSGKASQADTRADFPQSWDWWMQPRP